MSTILKGRTIIIDPGHGGRFDGKTNRDRKEKDITLEMSKILRDKLERKGATVYLTRTRDTDFGGKDINDDINKRVKYINKKFSRMDVLVSIHVNTEYGRVGSFHHPDAKASKTLAKNIAINNDMNYYEEDFAILRDTKASAKTLVEIGQIDDSWLDSSRELSYVASNIMRGIIDYFDDLRTERW
ncbi:N-acetylmuramoyl-L-alanine amidase family protein [Brevibacillus laterosporus]|uniref:N-acetylmuramoyl-L-alanine amidase n=1 Tax=Brevibacillus laterosporus TaxID=1465 RepID=A0AAP3G9M6_BRELA|nr:N-acetylmuramoyl-L-alanine amidase [Brevibacillus laterosporus]AYB39949.1 N-acetylmuramoyl-L-alanine amidase [Brevibacillus laterosporus]MBM7111316.1 Germination-specific N-acetylmuramoyl-L-alanine amidase precursor [Brevibacillus laterosporus]MCR8936343.1 N-acetylmuramoyl-L-alanine amidase [Brevibacillus laterosporus]MCR8982577.1 N-acetylmuramoyl-L-alanine amidase [Brevibacillus laterosporus]MCZ0809733.1 N-acetylmuramoyl-L-alanine amidase [Brevibacillus laterosporus]